MFQTRCRPATLVKQQGSLVHDTFSSTSALASDVENQRGDLGLPGNLYFRSSLCERTAGSCGYHLGSQRAIREYPGFHMVQDVNRFRRCCIATAPLRCHTRNSQRRPPSLASIRCSQAWAQPLLLIIPDPSRSVMSWLAGIFLYCSCRPLGQ